MNGPTHTVGSHSDDRGGESDWPCYCDQNVAPSNSKSEDTLKESNNLNTSEEHIKDTSLDKALLLGLANHTNEFLNPWLFKKAPSHEELAYTLDQIMNHSRLKSRLLAWHKAEVANLLQVIEDEVIGRDILMDNGTPVNHTLHNFRDRQRQALKKIKERL